MYEVEANYLTDEAATCELCNYPCYTCDITADNCTECGPGWILYKEENICYEDIEYSFPFVNLGASFLLLVLCADFMKKSTNFLHSLIFFLSFLELGVWAFLIYLFI